MVMSYMKELPAATVGPCWWLLRTKSNYIRNVQTPCTQDMQEYFTEFSAWVFIFMICSLTRPRVVVYSCVKKLNFITSLCVDVYLNSQISVSLCFNEISYTSVCSSYTFVYISRLKVLPCLSFFSTLLVAFSLSFLYMLVPSLVFHLSSFFFNLN